MKPSDKFAIIADDYTGAADSGIHFSRAGRKIDLLLQEKGLPEQLLQSNGISLTTESRFLNPENAASVVATTIQQSQVAGFHHFYKKIDSTLRGNPGSEIESALKVTGLTAALICSAMPSAGRTCLNGSIFLNNTPLHRTEIGSDPFNPISTSSVAELLGQQTSLPIGSLSIEDVEAGGEALAANIRSLVHKGCRLLIADAVTENHLLALASQVDAADFLPVGAGGFAQALAEVHTMSRAASVQASDTRAHGPILAVMGSLTEVSRQQADLACKSGCFLPFDIDLHDKRNAIEKKLSRLLADFGPNTPNILLRISGTVPSSLISKQEGVRVAQLFGTAATIICRQYPCRIVFSTGGNTSMAVAKALGIEVVTLLDEIMPGVVLGSCSAPNTGVKWFVSKAGGFGDMEILNSIAASFIDDKKGA